MEQQKEEKKQQQVNENQSYQKRERFEFILTVNDNIVCQRYFRINNFKWRSLTSNELFETFEHCVKLIKNDLKRKSNVFLWNTAPFVFKNKEEMLEHAYRVPSAAYVILQDTDTAYTWTGSKLEPYEGYYNKADYLKTENDTPCVLKFAFLDSGKEILSTIWDGNIYPRFVRTNIDLSNSKNKYDGNGTIFAPFECALIRMMTDGQPDLIPQIVKEFCICCSYENDSDYTSKVTYGDKTYNLNLYQEWTRYVEKAEKKCQKKTIEYFKNLY